MKECKICNIKTNSIFNIMFKTVHICENCANAVFIQQAIWYKRKGVEESIQKKFENFIKKQKDIPEEYLNIINEKFWDLI